MIPSESRRASWGGSRRERIELLWDAVAVRATCSAEAASTEWGGERRRNVCLTAPAQQAWIPITIAGRHRAPPITSQQGVFSCGRFPRVSLIGSMHLNGPFDGSASPPVASGWLCLALSASDSRSGRAALSLRSGLGAFWSLMIPSASECRSGRILPARGESRGPPGWCSSMRAAMSAAPVGSAPDCGDRRAR